jgi:hypothetical protein
MDGPAEGAEHALGVIARGMRLVDDGFALRLQARQQHGRLDLRAGDLRGILDALQRLPAMDAQRRKAGLGFDRGAHAHQGLDHALHRAPREGRIAVSTLSNACPANNP